MISRAASRTLGLSRSSSAAVAAAAGPAPPSRKPALGAARAAAAWLGLNLPVILMYCPVHLFFTLWTVSFTFLPLKIAAALWAAFLVPYYTLSSLGDFPHTGCREWPWLLRWFSENVERSLAHWFGSVQVVYDGSAADRAAHSNDAAPPLAPRVELGRAKAPRQGGGGGGGGAGDGAGSDGAGVGEAAVASVVGALAAAVAAHGGGGSLRRRVLGASAQRGQQQQEQRAPGENCAGATGSDRSDDGSVTSAVAGAGATGGGGSGGPNGAGVGAGAAGGGAAPRMIFGFHPHGFYPTGAGFLPMMESFRARLPGVRPSTLVANVLFVPPFLRDIAAWSGFRKEAPRPPRLRAGRPLRWAHF
ncbi:hypothetical protein MNEG_16510 [Monoraphidium neglectum]|uniref:Acyltransferase n=1 Tax=Monoraphidium neglectum TaxID=145388 RepID=A0A0D2LHE1_9CHLO|nr:hypothetical protein MNEG_16510 [Monoraphidium neglectum]KIY91454.1 hypothetical protein MNEG_16510 [Monoraphidium neglectum]|eukprot:XP_013890474.1 hypothetical protein MNEG_16510 [Monoraphidium neglectum]